MPCLPHTIVKITTICERYSLPTDIEWLAGSFDCLALELPSSVLILLTVAP